MTSFDPIVTNSEHYRVMFENDFVRVLEYTDNPGEHTTLHTHPNSVMVTLTDFERRLQTPSATREVALMAGQAVWLPAQEHSGENVGTTPTHVIFVELKGAAAAGGDTQQIGPASL